LEIVKGLSFSWRTWYIVFNQCI